MADRAINAASNSRLANQGSGSRFASTVSF
jgi:hypothetical protein